MTADNPFFQSWPAPLHMPPFALIKPEHFKPAFERAMAEQKAEHAAVIANPDAPTFENTLLPLQMGGKLMERLGALFGLLTGVNSTKELQAVEEELSPLLSRHHSELAHDPAMFARIEAVYQQRESLPAEARRLVEETYRDYVLSGAKLPKAEKDRLSDLDARLEELHTQFSNRLTNEVAEHPFVVKDRAQLEGVPEALLAPTAARAKEQGLEGYAISLMREEVEPILAACTVRDTRRALHEAFLKRGDNDDAFDTKALIPEILKLRQEKAKLLGFDTYAAYATTANMAKTAEAALGLMQDLWEPAKAAMARDQAELQAVAAADGLNEPLAPWDWIYYAEKVRQQKYTLDDAELRPYLSLENVRAAAFGTAEKLFGLSITPIPFEGWHADVRAYAVKTTAGDEVGMFLTDYFARPGKSSGAWMSELQGQHKVGDGQKPIIYNVCNYTKPPEGQPALLSLDAANTLFHEFGHGLHGLLSQATYPGLAGTNVYRDFVELPSQLYEHWLTEPLVMKQHLRHVETGAPMPDELIARIVKAKQFDEGSNAVRYLSSAIMDLELHQIKDLSAFDISKAESEVLARYGLPAAAQMMHRPAHHRHLFASSGYAANYYVYYWAAVLDNDAFSAFEEAGNPFDAAAAARLKQYIYSAGNTADPMALYEAFRGRAPNREALLRNKGLGDKAA